MTPEERVASSDRAEAINMIKAGDPTGKIADWFGWSVGQVENLRHAVARDFLRDRALRGVARRGRV